MISATIMAVYGLSALAAPAAAQEDLSRATASIRVEQSLAIASVQTMRFTPMTTRAGAAAPTQSGAAVLQITGDPGRSYRITLPSQVTAYPGGVLVEELTIVSANSGDVTQELSATVNAEGRDHLTISGQIAISAPLSEQERSAVFPIALYYE